MKQDDKTLLIFSAHPDDHLGCAGTAVVLKNMGYRIVEVVFTGGEKSVDLTSKKSTAVDKTKLKAKRKKEFEKASEIIGTDKTIFLGLPNNDIKRTPELIDDLMKIIRNEKPTIVISESPTDYHIDHRQIGEIVPEAVQRAGWGVSKDLGAPHKTVLGMFMGSKIESKRADILVDISEVSDKKQAILEVYKSQMGKLGIQLTNSVDSYYGFKLRVPAAEAFQLMSGVPINFGKLPKVFENEQKN